MTAHYAAHVGRKAVTPQTAPIPGSNQVENNAGGYVFAVDDWTRLDRFLILGAEGGSYYATERKLTVDNAQAVQRCVAADGLRVVNRIVEISGSGRAAKNDPALFVLAMCAAANDAATRKAALNALPKIARIGTHLFHFAEYVEAFRGWGRGLRRGIGNWYEQMDADRLALQVVKYRQRDGWSHRDLLRLAHPVGASEQHRAIYGYVTHGRQKAPPWSDLPDLIKMVEYLPTMEDREDRIDTITRYRIPRECIPTDWLNDPAIWEALMVDMPLGAMVRNLGKMTAVGVLKPLGVYTKMVCDSLMDREAIRKARLHPFSILLALVTYKNGSGFRGSLTWQPVGQIVTALEAAFDLSFDTVEPTGKRRLVAIDVSGSMMAPIMNSPLTAREAAAALAMITLRTEEQVHVVAFAGGGWTHDDRAWRSWRRTGLTPLGIIPRSLAEMVEATRRLAFGGTDCALPMLYAADQGLEVDAFEVYTDNETWAGHIHPVQALRDYRKQSGIDAKLVVTGMTATEFSIADPNDAGMLDVVGFDTAAPSVIADFIRD